MKRKTYLTPTTQVVILKQQIPLLSGSPTGNLGDPQAPEGDKEEDWD